MRTLDPDSDLAPYRQVAAALREAIEAGEFPDGQLPGRAELVGHFGLAVMTVRAGVRLLIDEGLLVSRPGKGVFVRETPAERNHGNEIDLLTRRIDALARRVAVLERALFAEAD